MTQRIMETTVTCSTCDYHRVYDELIDDDPLQQARLAAEQHKSTCSEPAVTIDYMRVDDSELDAHDSDTDTTPSTMQSKS